MTKALISLADFRKCVSGQDGGVRGKTGKAVALELKPGVASRKRQAGLGFRIEDLGLRA
jgi:hypothetical protein